MDNPKQIKLISLAILIALAIIWGSSFILMKKGLEVYSGMQVASLRILISSLALLPFALANIKKISKENVVPLFFIGAFGSGLPAFLFAYAQTRLDSSLAGILNSLTPLFAITIGWLFFKLKTTAYKILGVLVGLAGAFMITFVNVEGGFNNNYAYALMIILATACYGTSANVLKTKLQNMNPIHISSLAFMMIGLPAVLFLFSTDISLAINKEGSMQALLYIATLSVLGTALALILFNYLIQRSNVVFATMVTYLIPVVAMIWGVIDGELIGAIQVAGILVILIGIYLVNHNPKRRSDVNYPDKFSNQKT